MWQSDKSITEKLRIFFTFTFSSPQGFIKRFGGDRDAVLYAIQNCEPNLASKYFVNSAPQVKDDAVIIKAAANQIKKRLDRVRGKLNFVDRQTLLNELAAEPKIITALLKNGYCSLKETPAFQDNREAVLAAVERDGRQLQFASEGLRADPYVVERSIKKNALSLGFADEIFKKDHVIAMFAITQNPDAWNIIDPTLRENQAFIEEAYSINPNFLANYPIAFKCMSESKKRDPDFVYKAATVSPEIMQYVEDKETAFQVVMKENDLLEDVTDVEIATYIVQKACNNTSLNLTSHINPDIKDKVMQKTSSNLSSKFPGLTTARQALGR